MTTHTTSPDWLKRLVLAWTLLATFTFAVMLTHRSDTPTFFGRYSTLVMVQLGGLALGAAAGWFGVWRLKRHPGLHARLAMRLAQRRRRRGFALVVLTAAAVGLAAVWFWLLGNHLPAYAVLRWFVGFSILLAALSLLYGGGTEAAGIGWRTIVMAALALAAVVALASLSFYPVMAKADEAFDFSMGRNALEHGHVGPYIYRHSHPADYFGGLWTWVMAGWLKVVGVSFESGRLYTLFLSGVSLIFTGLAASRLYDRVTGWFAVFIGAFAFVALNHIRYHIHAAVWLSAGLFFYSLAYKHDRWWMHLLAGFTIAMPIDSNPVGYCFGLGLGLYYGLEYLARIRTQRWWWPFWWAAIGGGLAVGLYLVLHRHTGAFLGGDTGSMLDYYLDSIKSLLSSGGLSLQIQNYFTMFLTNQPILFGWSVVGLVTAAAVGSRADKLLLTVHFSWLAVIFLYIYFPVFYLVMAVPLFALLAARGLNGGLALLLNNPPHLPTALTRATAALLAVWLLVAMAKDIAATPSQSVEDVVETGRQIGKLLPKDALIVGAEPYYFGMIEHENFVGGSIEVYLQQLRAIPPDEVWSYLSPDAIIFSSAWPLEPQRSPQVMAYLEAENFVMLRCYQTKSFSRIELWVADVPQGTTPSETCQPVCNPRLGCES